MSDAFISLTLVRDIWFVNFNKRTVTDSDGDERPQAARRNEEGFL